MTASGKKSKTEMLFKQGMLLLLTLCIGAGAYAQEAAETETIDIATPVWEGQTNEDGTGLFFDIIRAVYEPAGIKMQFQIMPWKRAVQEMLSGKADAVLDMYSEDIAENMIAPSYPLLTEFTVAVFKKERIKEWKGIQSLSGLDLIWIRGYNYQNSRHLKGIKFNWSEIDEYDTAWRMLAKNRTDAYLDAYTDATAYIKENKVDMNLYTMETIGGDKGYMVCGKSPKSEEFVKIYDKRILELLASGELEKIFAKWNYPFQADTWMK
ncbi:MAG: transporter substrate-binding domain-containing protein [Desulfobacterales bacterium]